MSDPTITNPAAQRYDASRRRARDNRLPPGYPLPQPTAAWPAENIALLERFRLWLLSSSTNPELVDVVYIPTAGNALGYNLKPHPQIDIDADLERALDYVKAKNSSADWIKMSRNALNKFRCFLRQERGCADVTIESPNLEQYYTGLPDWLIEQIKRYQHLRQVNWRPTRLKPQIVRFWSTHTRLWRWLFEHYSITDLADIKRQHILDYVDHRLASGSATTTANQDLRAFHAFLLHLQDQGYRVPQALLRIPGLKEPDRLPRFLTDEQVAKVRDEFEQCVAQARTPVEHRNALLDRAAFYLLWQGGLRLSEAEELCLEDLDLPKRRLTVRQGKGRKDRTVYLTDTAVRALQGYLAVRGMGPSSHVFLYHNKPVCKDLIRSRIKAAGERVGVKVSPHCLRHTYATQLLNAGCRVTTIQKLMGHRRLRSTMTYARVHDRTVAEDYYAAMTKIEDRLALATEIGETDGHAYLLQLADRLAEPQLDLDTRLDLVAQMRLVLNCQTLELPPAPIACVTELW
jgi:site-specific recombinase XerD